MKKRIVSMLLTGLIVIATTGPEPVCAQETESESLIAEQGNAERAVPALEEIEGNPGSGDVVTFGSYEQDNNPENGTEPIEWEVLEVKDGKILLLSRYALDCCVYNEERDDVTWETCTLRKWLNQDFLSTAFSPQESERIEETTVVNADNSSFGTEGGNDTVDKLFLLSLDEIEQYYGIGSDEWYEENDSTVCRVTEYAKDRLISNWAQDYDQTIEEVVEKYQSREEDYGSNCCWWWLRSPGEYSYRAAAVKYDGGVGGRGYSVNYGSGAVRPAFWISLPA